MKKITFKYVPILALVLLFLATGQVNAGDVTILYAKALTAANPYSAWSADDLTTEGWSPTTNLTVDSSTNGLTLTVTGSKKSTTSTKTISYDSNVILTYDFIWYTNYTRGSKYANYSTSVELCDYLKFTCTNAGVASYSINGTSTDIASDYREKYLTVHAVINTKNSKMTALTITDSDGNIIVNLADQQLNAGSTFSTLKLNASCSNYYTTTALKQLEIQQETQVVTTASYTVNYTYDGNTVKTVTNDGVVDSYIPVLTAMDGDGNYLTTRYVIVADAVPSQAIVSGTNTLSVPVRPVYKTSLYVYRVLDKNQEENPFITQTLTETDAKIDSYTYVFPYYYNDGNKYYKATLKGESTNQFGETGTFTDESITKKVEYTTDDDVVYFADFDTDNNNNISYSNGAIEASTKSEKISTALDAGYYYITVNQATGYSSSLMNGTTTLATINDNGRTQLFKLTEAVSSDALTVSHATTNMRLDYILIKKAPTVSATVTNAGFATFSSDKALDFTNVTDISAYIATSIDANNNLVMTKVTGAVPASTGLLLKGTVGTAVTTTIPVAVSATAPTTNYFKSSVTATTVAATDATNNVYHYFLMSGNKGTGFYNVDQEMTSAAGKAYLETSSALATTSTASPINLIFNDGSTTTGINTINTVQKANNKIYDLCGQEVAAPNKGLYIMNGKKVVIK